MRAVTATTLVCRGGDFVQLVLHIKVYRDRYGDIHKCETGRHRGKDGDGRVDGRVTRQAGRHTNKCNGKNNSSLVAKQQV